MSLKPLHLAGVPAGEPAGALPPGSGASRRIPGWAWAGCVGLLLLAAYWPCLRGGMLWDDDAHVTRADLQPLSGLFRIWTNLRETQQYYPVLHSAFWLEHRLWGDATLGYHLLNVALHGLNACLFAAVLARLGRRATGAPPPPGAAWLAALLFAAHPVCVESVAWISEQKNTLSLAFYLLSGLAYLRFEAGRTKASYAAAFVLFCAALGTKTVTATLPAALLLMAWWGKGRISWRRDAVPLVPWFAIAGASGLLTAWVERRVVGAEGPAFDLTLAQRVLLAGRAVWFYLGKLLWPADLAFIYPRWNLDAGDARAWAFLAASVAMTAVLWLLRDRLRGVLVGWLFFVGSLFPALGFFNVFPFLYSFVADHFQYLASLGVVATCAFGIARLLERLPRGARPWGRAACALLVSGLALLSRLQSATYRDSGTLYRATIALNPACWMAEGNLAAELAGAGRTDEALAHYRRALEIRPDYPEAHNNLGNLLAATPGGGQEALLHYEEALRLRPAFAEAHTDLANLLSGVAGREAEAASHYEEALRLKPGDASAHFGLAGVWARTPGREADAIAEYRESLRYRPDSAEAHNNLGIVLSRTQGGLEAALAEYAQAVRIEPNYAAAHANMANVLAAMPGRMEQAFAEYREALRINPRLVQAHENMAILCLRAGRLDEAARHCEEALETAPNDAVAREILGRLRAARR